MGRSLGRVLHVCSVTDKGKVIFVLMHIDMKMYGMGLTVKIHTFLTTSTIE